ncbi:hypothetical protein DFH08DRAFT_823459 [Mycena albidolilacea]|uniref:Uncharacterized protein n=1 Tax=Mycena albidolilacea TaxID=1033008 RepID=A0AAD6Z5V9_9AGAR|nr:hypothetical protein DFH08DRAFT_823459 [Mycena albidolilacea]
MAQFIMAIGAEGIARQQPQYRPATVPSYAEPTTLGFRIPPPTYSPVKEKTPGNITGDAERNMEGWWPDISSGLALSMRGQDPARDCKDVPNASISCFHVSAIRPLHTGQTESMSRKHRASVESGGASNEKGEERKNRRQNTDGSRAAAANAEAGANPAEKEPTRDPRTWNTRLRRKARRLNGTLTRLEDVRAPAVVARGKQEGSLPTVLSIHPGQGKQSRRGNRPPMVPVPARTTLLLAWPKTPGSLNTPAVWFSVKEKTPGNITGDAERNMEGWWPDISSGLALRSP